MFKRVQSFIKGNKYWRFDDGQLEDDYPRDISVGFDKIPDYVDAAFALPAPGHHGKEKVFFFKCVAPYYFIYMFPAISALFWDICSGSKV